MQFILYNSPSLCLWETVPPNPPTYARHCRGPHRFDMYNHVTRHSSPLTPPIPFQSLFQTHRRKKKQTLSAQFGQPEIRKQHEQEKSGGVPTICGNMEMFSVLSD